MRINLTNILRQSQLPPPPPETVQRIEDQLRKGCELAAIDQTAAVTEILPILARYVISCPEDGKACELVWLQDGRRAWQMRPNASQRYQSEHRGVMIRGGVGVGKTTAMQIIASVMGTPMLTMVRLGAAFKVGGSQAAQTMLDSYDRCDLIIDDIGAETDARSYGDRLGARDIIMQRYDQWRAYGVRTHITTNCKPVDLASEDNIGLRAYDRLCEMCIPVAATGKSMRRKPD